MLIITLKDNITPKEGLYTEIEVAMQIKTLLRNQGILNTCMNLANVFSAKELHEYIDRNYIVTAIVALLNIQKRSDVSMIIG